ncbi:MAG: hypothetical protein ABI889_13745 [Gemmatimonadota bacterium]
MRRTKMVFSAAVVIAAFACSHNKQESAPSPSGDTRIKPSSGSTASRDTASEYGNQGTRMGSPSDSSRKEKSPSTTSTSSTSSTTTSTSGTSASGTSAGTAGQNDPSIIGSPAWWRTHLTADGKPRP